MIKFEKWDANDQDYKQYNWCVYFDSWDDVVEVLGYLGEEVETSREEFEARVRATVTTFINRNYAVFYLSRGPAIMPESYYRIGRDLPRAKEAERIIASSYRRWLDGAVESKS